MKNTKKYIKFIILILLIITILSLSSIFVFKELINIFNGISSSPDDRDLNSIIAEKFYTILKTKNEFQLKEVFGKNEIFDSEFSKGYIIEKEDISVNEFSEKYNIGYPLGAGKNVGNTIYLIYPSAEKILFFYDYTRVEFINTGMVVYPDTIVKVVSKELVDGKIHYKLEIQGVKPEDYYKEKSE